MKTSIGIDCHQESLYMCAKDWFTGNIIVHKQIKPSEISLFMQQFNSEECKCVVESGTYSLPTYDALQKLGFFVIMAHAKSVKLICSATLKNDKVDAAKLADLLRVNMLPESYVPTEQIRDIRSLLRLRVSTVKQSTKAKNQSRAILARIGLATKDNIFTKKRRIEYPQTILNPVLRFQYEQLINHVESLRLQVKKIDEEIEKICLNYPDIELLRTIPLVGLVTAATIFFELGDYRRFTCVKQVAAYAGLVPTIRQSGSSVMYGGITKQGSSYIRRVLVQVANLMVLKPSKFQIFYQQLRARSSHKIAIVATAHLLLRIMFGILKTKTAYRTHA